MIVQKYGGSSVATIEKIKAIAENIKKTVHEKVIIVVSAMGKTTNNLLEQAKQICETPNKREVDALISTGEQQSASLMAMALCDIGVKAISLNAMQAKIHTTSNFGKALIKKIDTKHLTKLFEKFDAIVITGFQGVCRGKNITTLGRGGSDTTAVALASAMNAMCEIFTDVEAIYSVNPSLHKDAKKLKVLNYNLALEMASSGAKVLDERAIEIAKKFGTEIYLGKTLENDHSKGTYVMNKNFLEEVRVNSISIRENVFHVSLQANLISQVIKALKQQNQNLEMLAINSQSISFVCKKEHQKSVEKALKKIQKQPLKTSSNLTRITLVGYGFMTHTEIVEKLYEMMSEESIRFDNLYLTETTISFLIPTREKHKTIKSLVELYEL